MQFLQIADFGGQLHQSFALSIGETSMALTLVEIQALPIHVYPGRTRDPFSLIFQSASPIVVPQAMYRLTHDGMGQMEMFLVPVGLNSGGVLYQAVFN